MPLEDEAYNHTEDYSNNNSLAAAETDSSGFTETSENKIDKTEDDNSMQNILTKDDLKGIVADWEKHWRNWLKTDKG